MKITFLTALSLSVFTAIPAHTQTTTPVTESFVAGDYISTDGEELYQSLCAGCHMPDGAGAVGAGEYPALRENPNLEYASYPTYIIINGQAAMPSMGHLLSDEQIVELTTFLQTHLGNDYDPNATVEMVADTRPESAIPELAEHEIADTSIDADREEIALGGAGTELAIGTDTEQNGGTETRVAADLETEASRVVRHLTPGSDFPILMAAEISADATLVYLSGTVPQVIDDTAQQGSPERYGDTTAQTVSTLSSIEQKLASLDLTMGDVVKMQAYLVAPAGSDAMDFNGFMKGYLQYFGTEEQPDLPTRSVFEVAGLANPSWLVEIEVVAVRP